MPIKISIVTSGLDYPRTKRLEWVSDLDMDESNLVKSVLTSNTETECSTTLYFEDQSALDAYTTTNAAKIEKLNDMRDANSMITVQTIETVDTIP